MARVHRFHTMIAASAHAIVLPQVARQRAAVLAINLSAAADRRVKVVVELKA
jgi:hypothetical protein